MNESDQGHGKYVRKVLDGGTRYAQELLEKNNDLRALVAKLQVQEHHLLAQLEGLRATGEQAKDLKARLLAAEQESDRLRDELAEARAAIEAHVRDQDRLEVLLRRVDDENRRYDREFAQVQQQANNLANLYVAVYRVHGTLDREQLLDTLKEIVANLIGCEEVAFFERDDARDELSLIGSTGIDPTPYRRLPLDRGLIAAAVADGNPAVIGAAQPRGPGEEHLTVVIPLRLVDVVNGAIALFRLLPQKPGIQDLDRELFDLLASHAGVALHCTELHARYVRNGAGQRPSTRA